MTPGYANTEVEVEILGGQVRFVLYSQQNNLRFVVWVRFGVA